MTISVILVAGGIGSRMKSFLPKQFLLLKGKAVALYSFETFSRCPPISEIIVVCEKKYRSLFPSHAKFADPGQRRQDSVFNGLQLVSPSAEFVCIHDSARPFLSLEDLSNVIAAAQKHGAATLAVPAKNTIKEADTEGFIAKTLDRSKLWEMYTPQIARLSLLQQGFSIAREKNLTVTDDNALLELIPHPVKIVHGNPSNIKITTPEDWVFAESLASLL